MSVRTGTLCDITIDHGPNSGSPCDRASIGVCFVCARDLCEEHTIHRRGLTITIALQTGGPACEHDRNKPIDTRGVSNYAALICWSCTNALTRKAGERFSESATALSTKLRDHLKAALAEEALA